MPQRFPPLEKSHSPSSPVCDVFFVLFWSNAAHAPLPFTIRSFRFYVHFPCVTSQGLFLLPTTTTATSGSTATTTTTTATSTLRLRRHHSYTLCEREKGGFIPIIIPPVSGFIRKSTYCRPGGRWCEPMLWFFSFPTCPLPGGAITIRFPFLLAMVVGGKDACVRAGRRKCLELSSPRPSTPFYARARSELMTFAQSVVRFLAGWVAGWQGGWLGGWLVSRRRGPRSHKSTSSDCDFWGCKWAGAGAGERTSRLSTPRHSALAGSRPFRHSRHL